MSTRWDRWDAEHPSLFGRDVDEGRARRDSGIRLVEMASHLDPWPANAWRAVETLVRVGAPFCSDEVRLLAGDPVRPNQMGALFRRAVREGVVEWKGELTMSERPEAHARLVKLWHPARRGAA